MVIIIKEGVTIPIVAIIPPNAPAVLYPTKVAVFIPIGPGVDSDMAIISSRSWDVIQPYFHTISWRNGIVANPPPIENNPILKNTKKSFMYIILYQPFYPV